MRPKLEEYELDPEMMERLIPSPDSSDNEPPNCKASGAPHGDNLLLPLVVIKRKKAIAPVGAGNSIKTEFQEPMNAVRTPRVSRVESKVCM